MNYKSINDAYRTYFKALAQENNISVQKLFDRLINQSMLRLHTLEIAELISGYYAWGEENIRLAEEGLVDIYGDKKR